MPGKSFQAALPRSTIPRARSARPRPDRLIYSVDWSRLPLDGRAARAAAALQWATPALPVTRSFGQSCCPGGVPPGQHSDAGAHE
jgi:hypothetical protein